MPFDTSQLPPEIIPWIIPGAIFITGMLLSLWVIYVGSLWLVYSKANRAGWLIFIPIVNVIMMMRIANQPLWHLILLLIPIVNVFVLMLLWINLGKAFGKGTLFGLGLIFFHWLFVVMLAFDKSEYHAPLQKRDAPDDFQPMNIRPS